MAKYYIYYADMTTTTLTPDHLKQTEMEKILLTCLFWMIRLFHKVPMGTFSQADKEAYPSRQLLKNSLKLRFLETQQKIKNGQCKKNKELFSRHTANSPPPKFKLCF